MRRSFIMSVLSVAFLWSCTMSGTRIYSLSLPAAEQAPHAGAAASINVFVAAPRYLEQPYIAYRSSPYELELSSFARWDAAPADMVKGAVKDSLYSSGSFAAVTASALTPPGSTAAR
jgi:uncharacterized lipoprotein YmbA